jgi:hypothetical protein
MRPDKFPQSFTQFATMKIDPDRPHESNGAAVGRIGKKLSIERLGNNFAQPLSAERMQREVWIAC